MLAFAAFVTELCRDALRRRGGYECVGRFMTTGAIIARRFLVSPVTVKTGVVTMRRGFKELAGQV